MYDRCMMEHSKLPKSLWRFAPRIDSFGPSPSGYLAELTPGFAWYGAHSVTTPTIRGMVQALGNLRRCGCAECATAPPEVLSIGAQLAQMRKKHFGGRMPIPTRCERCGDMCASAIAARSHCRTGSAGRPPVPTDCRRCGAPCASRVEARDHCRVSERKTSGLPATPMAPVAAGG